MDLSSLAEVVREWITAVGAKTAYIERASTWENGYIESFNARLRDELLNGEIFYSLREAQIVIESWRRHYNHASDRMRHSVINRQHHQKCSCPRSPRGRLRYVDRLRRPRWRPSQP
jgi:integrase-like protein